MRKGNIMGRETVWGREESGKNGEGGKGNYVMEREDMEGEWKGKGNQSVGMNKKEI